MAVGAYPGSFDPPTVAHLAVAEAALHECRLERVDLILSRSALGKEGAHHASVDDRAAVLQAMVATRPWLGVVVTRSRLLVDIAAGYDVLVMGADKWAQVVDASWYGSPAARDEALRRLPAVAVAPRPGWPVPDGVVVLPLHEDHREVSSTAVRAGSHHLLVPEAAALAEATGAWVDPERYARRLAEGG